MSAKRKWIDTRTLLIILLVLIIIAAGYIVITNMPVEETSLTPEEVLRNKDKYLESGSIVVKGYFIYEFGSPVVVSTLSNTEGRESIKLSFDNIDENETDKLRTETIFRFTGVLIKDPADPLGLAVLFEVEKIDEV